MTSIPDSEQAKIISSTESRDLSQSTVLRFLIACYVWTVIPVLTVIFATAVVVSTPFVILVDKRRNFLHNIATAWAKSIVACNPWWTFIIEGHEHLPEEGIPVVYVANHQSQADIVSVFLLSRQFRWLAKDSLFKIPFLGWAMSAAGYVPVKRGDRRSHVECMQKSREHLSNGTPMLFFPEGTRSKDGKLLPFKGGAFKLALDTHTAIVPLTLEGAATLLPKGSLVPSVATVRITIHKPISSDGHTEQELMDTARKAIESGLKAHALGER